MRFSRKQHFFVEKSDFFVDFDFICFLFTKIVKNARLLALLQSFFIGSGAEDGIFGMDCCGTE